MLETVLKGHRPRVPLNHLHGFPSAKVLDGEAVDARLPQETGEGSAKRVRIAGESGLCLKSLQHRLDSVPTYSPEVAVGCVLLKPGLQVSLAEFSKRSVGLFATFSECLDGSMVGYFFAGYH